MPKHLRTIAFFFVMLAVMFFYAASGFAADTVRVGVFSLSGFYNPKDKEDSEASGYTYDYLQELAQYTGWKYEYIHTSWEECLNLLERGEIDLLGLAQHTPERDKKFAYADLESGVSHAVLSVAATNTDIAFEDFAAFDGMRVGLMMGNQCNQNLIEYCKLNDFSIQPSFYPNEEALTAALHVGEIEAMLLSSLRKADNERIVARFAPSPFFYITSKNRPDILKKLNDAQSQIKLHNPYFDAELHQKYFYSDASSMPVFTRAEQEFIKHSPAIVVAIRTAWPPLEYMANGKAQGIMVDYLQRVHDITGLNFNFLPTPTLESAITRLKRNEVTLISSVDKNYPFSIPTVRTAPLLSSFVVMVTDPTQSYSADKPIAMTQDFWRAYPGTASNEHYQAFATVRDCFEALRTGRVAAVYANSLVAEHLRREFDYSRFMVTSLPGRKEELCFAMSRDADPRLLSIFNKIVLNASDATMQNFILKNSFRPNELTLKKVIEQNPLESILITGAVLLLVIIGLGYIVFIRSRTSRHIYKLLYIDKLTGAWNYTYFIQYLKNIVDTPHRPQYAIAYMDIERFKDVNDAHGYAYGDYILKSIAKVLKQSVFNDELYARISNDNFVAILHYTTEKDFIDRINTIYQKINRFAKYEPYRLMIMCGISILSDDDTDAASVVDRANEARKTIKGHRKANYAFYSASLRDALVAQREIESAMESALATGQFEAFFQPKINLADASIVGAEALARWRHPERGIIAPYHFIPLFEKNGFIVKLDFYIFESVCRMLREHIDAGKTPIPISSNFSRAHFSHPGFTAEVYEIVRKYDISPHLLELEVTESVVDSTPDALLSQLEELRNYGFHVAMDDFGTGYSSLNLLKNMPIDILKLDKDFLQQGIVSEKDCIIITGFVHMAQKLKFTVVCEGVETAEQAHFLRSIGCDQAQGFLFAKPMPKKDFVERLYGETS